MFVANVSCVNGRCGYRSNQEHICAWLSYSPPLLQSTSPQVCADRYYSSCLEQTCWVTCWVRLLEKVRAPVSEAKKETNMSIAQQRRTPRKERLANLPINSFLSYAITRETLPKQTGTKKETQERALSKALDLVRLSSSPFVCAVSRWINSN